MDKLTDAERLQLAESALAGQVATNAALLRRLVEAEQAHQVERTELYALIDKAQTAQRAWTEIGAKAEATAVELRGVLEEAAALLIRPTANTFDRELAARLREYARAQYETPLLSAAQKIVHAWDRLCDCVSEFEDYNLEAEACGELKQYLDDAIVALKGLIAGDRAATVPEVSRAGIDSASGAGDDGSQQGESDA